MKCNTIALLGGDKRQLFCADALYNKGFKVLLAGFDLLESYGHLKLVDLDTALSTADAYILPVTGVKGDRIPCYFSDKEIKIDSMLRDYLREKPVFMGRANSLRGVEAYDLLKREDFAVLNAVPTVEGALCVAIKGFEKTLCSSRVLVIGYGRIGKVLSRALRALGAEVSVASRESFKRAYIKADGNRPVITSDIKSLDGFDIVFNTADGEVINAEILKNSQNRVLIIDLASYPGGVDFDAAQKLGFTAFMASGLPGQYSPASAGEIIADTVLTILREESL
ncbi:MAG: NAD(P)-binding domain-containing protein [Ruminococcus sp.]|nr:NAD(P)-binding domain-containing protein [Ruminococcus sp.]